MKAMHGFSPLSVATLVVASVWLPIVLFPYGGAILMNIVFIYVLREYRANKGEDIFRIFTWITAFTCALFLVIALVVPFEFAYRLLREAALIGPILREDLPTGKALIAFQWVIVGALLCANPYFFREFNQGVKGLDIPLAPHVRRNLEWHWDYFWKLQAGCLLLIGIQIAYLSGYMADTHSSSDEGRFGSLVIEIANEIVIILLNYLVFSLITIYASTRATFNPGLRKKF